MAMFSGRMVYVLAPLQLTAMMRLVEAFSNPGDLVLDPFIGSGTTAVAAKQLGRRYIGIDIEPVYAVTAQERVRSERRAA